jgi:phenylacetic acid degradation operon negative regulatory protein
MAAVANSSYELPRGLTARALVLDFLSMRSPREISAAGVLAAGAALGFSAQNIRMALTRLVEQKAALNTGRGRYRLSASGETMRQEVRKWRQVGELTRPWSGDWIAVHDAIVPRSDRAALRRHEQAMRLRGLREFLPGLWIRPANLRDPIAELREQLRALGLHPSALVVGLSGLDATAGAKAASLWDTTAMLKSYQTLHESLIASRRRLDRMPVEAAAAESLTLGREVIRHINLDPLLPEQLMPQRPLRDLVRAMIEYDADGRRIWRQFMRQIEGPQ